MPVGATSERSQRSVRSKPHPSTATAAAEPPRTTSTPAVSPLRPTDQQKRDLLVRLDGLRLTRGLNWTQLAKLCGVAPSTIYNAIQYGRLFTDLTYVRILQHVGAELGIPQIGSEHA